MSIFGGESMKRDTLDALTAVPKVIAKAPVEAAVDLLTLKNPVAGVSSIVRQSVKDLALWPFRITEHFLVGGAKTFLKLGWGAFVNSPIIPFGNGTKSFLRSPTGALGQVEASLSAGKSFPDAIGLLGKPAQEAK